MHYEYSAVGGTIAPITMIAASRLNLGTQIRWQRAPSVWRILRPETKYEMVEFSCKISEWCTLVHFALLIFQRSEV